MQKRLLPLMIAVLFLLGADSASAQTNSQTWNWSTTTGADQKVKKPITFTIQPIAANEFWMLQLSLDEPASGIEFPDNSDFWLALKTKLVGIEREGFIKIGRYHVQLVIAPNKIHDNHFAEKLANEILTEVAIKGNWGDTEFVRVGTEKTVLSDEDWENGHIKPIYQEKRFATATGSVADCELTPQKKPAPRKTKRKAK